MTDLEESLYESLQELGELHSRGKVRAEVAEAKLTEILEVLDILPTQLVRNWENYTELYEWADHERCDRIRIIVKREGGAE